MDDPNDLSLLLRQHEQGVDVLPIRKKIERDWDAGYRISDRNNFLVAGFYGYGLNPEEVKNWCDEQESSR